MSDKIVKTEKEWRTELSDEVFEITRKGGSERAFSHDNFPDSTGFSIVSAVVQNCLGPMASMILAPVGQLFSTAFKFGCGGARG